VKQAEVQQARPKFGRWTVVNELVRTTQWFGRSRMSQELNSGPYGWIKLRVRTELGKQGVQIKKHSHTSTRASIHTDARPRPPIHACTPRIHALEEAEIGVRAANIVADS